MLHLGNLSNRQGAASGLTHPRPNQPTPQQHISRVTDQQKVEKALWVKLNATLGSAGAPRNDCFPTRTPGRAGERCSGEQLNVTMQGSMMIGCRKREGTLAESAW